MTIESREQDHGSARASRKSRGSPAIIEAGGSGAELTSGNLLELEGAEGTPVSAPMGVAMIALNMAFKWHDLGVIKDGALYQQYKLEGRNIPTLHLDMVFETARRIERHLLVSSQEIAELMVSGVLDALQAADEEAPLSSETTTPQSEAQPSASAPATDEQP